MDLSTVEPPSNTASDPPAVDGSSDDKPLAKLKTSFVPPKKLKENTRSKSNGTNKKKAGDDSDDEPLTKISQVSSEAVKKSPKESDHSTKEESEEGDGSSGNDEPLSEAGEKLKSQPRRGLAGKTTPASKSRRPAAKNKVQYAETSNSSSDDETLASMKTKKTNVPQRRKTSPKKKTNKQTESDEEVRSSDDDEPLGEIAKKLKSEPRRRSAGKTTPVRKSRRAAAMNKDMYVETSTESSDDDDELLPATKTRKTSGNKKTPTKKKEKPLKESSNSSDDDEPLRAIKAKVSTNKKTDEAQKGKHVDSSDDDEPLTSIETKKTNNSKKQKLEKTTKRGEKRLKAESQDDDGSSNDEVLRETAAKLKSKPSRKSAVKPTPVVTKSRRSAAMNKVKYVATSSDDSDDKPLDSRRTKKTNVTKQTSTRERNTKSTHKVKKSSSEEDDEPLANVVGRALNKRRAEPSDGSSDDEPLTKQVKKSRAQKQTKRKAATPKKTNATSRKPRGRPLKGKNVSESSISSQSDDASFTGAAKHPQVTKILRVTLERCDTGDAARLPTGGTDGAPTAEKLSEESAPE